MSSMRTESAALDRGEPHHVPGQLNIYVLDVESHVTGYGRHNRLVGPFRGTGDESHVITLREDVRNLPESSETDRRRVLNGAGRMHARGRRLVHVSSVRYTGYLGESIEHQYHLA